MSGVENDGLTFVGIDFEAISQEEPVEPVEVRLEYGLQDVGAAGISFLPPTRPLLIYV